MRWDYVRHHPKDIRPFHSYPRPDGTALWRVQADEVLYTRIIPVRVIRTGRRDLWAQEFDGFARQLRAPINGEAR